MTEIPMRSAAACDRNSVLHINRTTRDARSAQNITSLNDPPAAQSAAAPQMQTQAPPQMQASSPQIHSAPSPAPQAPSGTAASTAGQPVPQLIKQIRKGQKVPLDPTAAVRRIRVCLGWNTNDPRCDIDVSAFILGRNGQVPGDDWFVFYGQEYSPDKCVRFSAAGSPDRQYISADLAGLSPLAEKIVFVLTINDAAEYHLNFSMVSDAYVRILNEETGQELVSFLMTDYYPNVISMMICEVYLHNGVWKCNAIGNGVTRDLAGLCELYGVSVI